MTARDIENGAKTAGSRPATPNQPLFRLAWDRPGGGGGDLYLCLRHRGKRRNRRGRNGAGRGVIPGRVDISERPAIVEGKVRVGDWEVDTIVGARHSGVIVSMVDRASKFTLPHWLTARRRRRSVPR